MNINKLSDVFRGKVPGVNQEIDFDAREEHRKKVEKLPELNFDYKIPEFNFKTGMNMKGDIEGKVFGNIENQSWRRMKKQKGLPLFGDKDKDGSLNIFDCAPMNKFLQANVHSQLEVYDVEQKKLPDSKTYVAPGQVDWQDAKSFVKTAPKALWLGITEPFRENKQEAEYRKQLLEAARKGELERIKAGKVSPREYLKLNQKEKTRPVQEVSAALGQGTAPYTMVDESLGASKISRLIGLQRDYGPQVGQAVGAPVQEQVSVQQGGVSQPQQPQQPQQQLVYSERSKRPVSYKRGPYRKSKPVQYVPPPQQ